MNSNRLPIEEQIDKLRLKCLKDLVELARLDKDWNPEEPEFFNGMVDQ